MANHPVNPADFILGIDLGTNSVGWAMIAWKDGGPAGMVRAGSRVFDAGMDVDNKSGKESSRNLARRTARLIRRQHWRRGRRLKKVFHLLKDYGLLPDMEVSGPEKRQDFINELDHSIFVSAWFSTRIAAVTIPEPQQVMLYILRTAALDEPLEPFHFGRALFHLAQRRGFESNRKERAEASKDKEEEEGKVKSGIAELQKAMEASGARTLGEYFSGLNPNETRIRKRWTARAMYKSEFEQMWEAQARFHPSLLTPERKKELYRAIFFQRKLRPQNHLIGSCELEPAEQRAPAYLLTSQRFRLLQKVNDLRILPAAAPERRLSPEEREKLLHALELEGDQTFAGIRKLLGLSKTAHFNLAEGGETKIAGNRTASQIDTIVVSHRPQKKVSGALHEETFYGAAKNTGQNVRRVRKPLANLSKTEVHQIVDLKIREIVLDKLQSLGKENPGDVFSDEKNLPCLQAADGRQIPIKFARVFKKLRTFPLGSGRMVRHVVAESNHHIEVFAELDHEGNEVEWDGIVVPTKEACQRVKERKPVVQRDHGPNRRFKFSLAPGEILKCETSHGRHDLFVVRATSQDGPRVALVAINDARPKKAMTKDDYIRRVPDSLRRLNARKIAISPLGEVAEAHD